MDLGRHVPLIARTWDEVAPGVNHRAVTGTLLFADISGFTALTERLKTRGRVGAEEIIETLNGVFGSMLDLAGARGGELLKFGGDALLFLFTGSDHAEQACDAAVEMRQELRQVAATPTAVGRLRLAMSVGIHSADIDLFLVGSPTRELFILGPAANAIIQAEKRADAGQIVLSEEAAAFLPAGATRPRDDGALLLRRRNATTVPAGLVTEPRADGGRLAELFPEDLGRYLAPGPPEPEHRNACIGFIRFSGTDAFLAERGPEALGTAVAETVRLVQDALGSEDGTLLATDLDVDGGRFFIASGVPRSSEDDEGRMLRAMRRLLDSRPPLPLQIGVNRGHVFAAEIGVARRAAYTGMGDTTNTAARIMAKAAPGQLLAHPSVVERSRTLYAVTPAGPYVMKGKAVPLLVYAVGEEVGTRESADSAELPFLGREQQTSELQAAITEALTATGAVITITGGTGLGKTRLAREVLDGVQAQVLAVRAEPYGAASAYRVFRDAVRSLLNVSRDTPTVMGQMLVDGLSRLDPALLPVAPLLADVAQVEVPDNPETAAIDPQFRPERVSSAFVDLLGAAYPGPLVVVAEEAHWADVASAKLLEALATAARERPWAVLVIRRPDLTGGFSPEDGVTVQLDPLPDSVIGQLAQVATESTALRPHEIAAIADKAGGSPLFVQEVSRLVREAGALDTLPDSVQTALSTQIDLLAPHSRRILRYCSVLGRSFRREILAATLEADGVGVDDATWSDLAAFVEPDGDTRLRFRNGLVRDAAYEGLAYRTRTRLHAAAARATEQLSVDVASDAATLSLHAWRAGDQESAWTYARMAGDVARRTYANADAADQYERALEASRRLSHVTDAERAQMWTLIGDLRELNGMMPEAVDAHTHAAALAADPVASAESMVGRARALERAGKYTSALRTVTRARRLLEGSDTPGPARRVRVQLDTLTALIRLGQERPADAARWARQAAADARDTDDPETLVQALTAIDFADLLVGKAVAGDHTREALEICIANGFRPRESIARANLGAFSFYAGRWAEAVDWYRSSRAVAIEAGNAFGAAETDLNLAEILIHLDRIDEAEEALRQAVRVLDVSGVIFGVHYGEMLQARILLARGDHAGAEERARQVADRFLSMGHTVSAFEASLVRAEAAIAAGDPERGLMLIADAETAAKGEGGALAPRVELLRARALLGTDRTAEAGDAVASGLAAARQQELPYEEALLLAVRSTVHARSDDPEAATAAAQDAADSSRILAGLGAESVASHSV